MSKSASISNQPSPIANLEDPCAFIISDASIRVIDKDVVEGGMQKDVPNW
jgi:hypothetical protein